MKTKLLLTVLFSIGIIGITSAQGLAKNDFGGGPRRTAIVRVHEPSYRVMEDHRFNRHERKRMRREERRHERQMRHRRHF